MERIYYGGHLQKSPKKKEQKGFRGYHNDGGKPFTLSKEVVQLAPFSFEIKEVRLVRRNKDGVLTGFITHWGRSRKVVLRTITDPSPGGDVTYVGQANVWVLI